MASRTPARPPTGQPLRPWQESALRAYQAAGAQDFLVTATPGSGKTALALAVARELLAAGEAARLIVVCPTDHLRSQWARAAQVVGLALDPALPNSVGPVGPDVLGYVATYAQVAQKPLLHRRRTEARRTLVVLDEIHHAGDSLSWGEAVREAFEPARRRLALTGTPFRTRPEERIPFVRYAQEPAPDGATLLRSLADVSYGYAEALADGVVRPVVFAAYTGVSRWVNSAGAVVSASLSEPASREQEALAWRTALDPGGSWVPHVLAAMDDRLTGLRAAGMTDAAGLVLASDQADARAYAGIVARVTGRAPALITSDDPQAGARLAEFAGSGERIAVCVRMVSEGVDIPRAACLAWLTSYRTPLFFAQAVGRVVRAQRPGESATVFLPAVRPLLALAAEMEAERNHVLAPPPRGELLDVLPAPERDAPEGTRFTALGAEARFAHVLHGGRAVTAEEASLADADFLGLPGLLSAEQTALLLARRDQDLRRRLAGPQAGTGVGAGGPAEGPNRAEAGQAGAAWEQARRLRREVHALVARVAARTGQPHARVHAQLRAAVPGPGSATASLAVLARRRDHLLGLL